MAKDTVKYRLGLDMGTNSIGWAAVRLDEEDEPSGTLGIGSRVFTDGRQARGSGEGPSNAARRREARGQRRLRDRYLRRRTDLTSALVEYGLMPEGERERKALERLNPYRLRANALDEKLPAHHIGRALFHLSQRRGFRSNRKSEQRDTDTGPVKDATKKLTQLLDESGHRTLGEFLYQRRRQKDTVRFRNLNAGARKAEYEFYPTRQMILDEFNKIWDAQAPRHTGIMTDEARGELEKIIFRQREIQSPPVGKCTLDPALDKDDHDGFRCSWAHPLAQQFRVWQEVRNLRVGETGGTERPLSREEGDRIAQELFRYQNVTFDKMRKLLSLSSDAYFNLESERRKKLSGDETAAKLSHKDLFGKTWRQLPHDRQIEIVEYLMSESDEDNAVQWLTQRTSLGRAAAERVSSAFLPSGHCRLGLRAINSILPHMKEGLDYYEAAKAAGYDPARERAGELSPTGRLPRYNEWLKDHLAGTGDPNDPPDKRWGRFPNPTVHIGLNQLRRVVNALIKEYGRPHEVVVEVNRDLRNSKKKREAIAKEQAANQKRNKNRDKDLRELNRKPNYENRLKLRLWEELNPKNAQDRRCPFTGEPISMGRLFSDDDVEVDHLIPWKDSWDDSAANKIVCMRGANRGKGRQTPYEAFGDTPEWEAILQRAARLPKNKRWRFGKDARQQFEKQGGFQARQLHETSWLSRVTKEYLSAVASPNDIWVIPGRLTDMIRNKWGLDGLLHNENFNKGKNRNDHRHHAIDAFVVALTSRSLLQRMSSEYDYARSRIIVPDPWVGFRKELEGLVEDMVVSHKPDHGTRGAEGKTTGQLHNATGYGIIKISDEGPSKLVRRRKLRDMKLPQLPEDLRSVRNENLRDALMALWNQIQEDGGDSVEFADHAAEKGVLVNGKYQKRKGLLKDLGDVKDFRLKVLLVKEWEDVRKNGGDDKDFFDYIENEGVVLNSGRPQCVRSVRVIEEHQNIVAIRKNPRDDTEEPYKAYLPDNNEFADVSRMPDRSWQMEVVSTFDANQSNSSPEDVSSPTKQWLMRLQIDDMGSLGEDAERRIVRVRKITNARDGVVVILDEHNEANVPSRVGKDMRENRYSARQLQQQGFRKVHVDAIGRVVWDPGPFKP